MPLDIVMKLKPIFAELGDESLMEKCLHGKTQNQNESFNSMIWDRIPQMRYVSFTQLEFGMYDAVANFNIGKKASVLIYEKMNLIPGKFTLQACDKINRKRLSSSKLKKWTLQENEEKYDVVKQSKKMTKMNPKKDRLIRLHNVILCFRISVIVFRIYNWKKFQICLIFCVFFSNLVFSKCYFLHAGKNISRMP